MKSRPRCNTVRRSCISGICTLLAALSFPTGIRLANALGMKDFDTGIVDRAVHEAKQQLKPGTTASEVEAFYRSKNYRFGYLEPGRIELQKDKDHRQAGIDFVGRYFGTSPDFVITDKRGHLIMIIEITC